MTSPPKSIGTSIKIFLVSGEPDGVWEVEKSNWTGKALVAPRTRYDELLSRPALKGPGVYLLLGPADSGQPAKRIYIGETEDLLAHLDIHNSRKGFWDRAVVFTSKDASLNTAQFRYLETRLIELAKKANRAELENSNHGSTPQMSDGDAAEAEAFLAELLVIYQVLGIQVFEEALYLPAPSTRFYLDEKYVKAEGAEGWDGFLVYDGSLARAETVPSCGKSNIQIRKKMIRQGLLVTEGQSLRLTENYRFRSPSAAACVFSGRASNGRITWRTKGDPKTADGKKTLRDIQNSRNRSWS